MNRRDFLQMMTRKSAGFTLGTAALVSTELFGAEDLPTSVDLPPLAPVGPSPLCDYPRGLFARATPEPGAPWESKHRAMKRELESAGPDWILLKGYFSIGKVCAQSRGLPAPRTWREAIQAIAMEGRIPDREDTARRLTAAVESCGLDPDSEPPANLFELYEWCIEWAYARGRFADGMPYRLPAGFATIA